MPQEQWRSYYRRAMASFCFALVALPIAIIVLTLLGLNLQPDSGWFPVVFMVMVFYLDWIGFFHMRMVLDARNKLVRFSNALPISHVLSAVEGAVLETKMNYTKHEDFRPPKSVPMLRYDHMLLIGEKSMEAGVKSTGKKGKVMISVKYHDDSDEAFARALCTRIDSLLAS